MIAMLFVCPTGARRSLWVRTGIAIMTSGLLLLLGTAAAFAQETRLSWAERISVETGCGSYRVPGLVLGFDPSITQHPRSLNGFNCSLQAGFNLNRRWSLGVQVFEAPAAGNGPWARTDGNAQLAAEGLVGSTTGTTHWKVRGAAFSFGQTFLDRSRVHPFWRAGLGIGKLDVNFSGTFNGCSTQDIGCFYPVSEPAADAVSRTIPIVSGEGGLQIDVSRGFEFRAGPYWNTGLGGTFSTIFRF